MRETHGLSDTASKSRAYFDLQINLVFRRFFYFIWFLNEAFNFIRIFFSFSVFIPLSNLSKSEDALLLFNFRCDILKSFFSLSHSGAAVQHSTKHLINDWHF